MSIKRSLIALSAAAFLGVAGCSSDGGDSTEPTTPPDQQLNQGDDGPFAGQGEQPEQPEQPEAPEADVDDLPDVIAEVNGEEISRDEFVTTYEGQLQQASAQAQQSGEDVDQDQLKQQVADTLVNNLLLTQAAADAGIEATDDDVDSTLDDIAAQSGLESGDDLIATLGEQGMDEEEIRSQAADQYVVTAYIDQEADVQEPSDDELRAQYDQMVEQMGGEDSGSDIPPFEEVRDQLAQQATADQQSQAVSGILDGLREDADVTINL